MCPGEEVNISETQANIMLNIIRIILAREVSFMSYLL